MQANVGLIVQSQSAQILDDKVRNDIEACADAILARVGKRIVLGLPVGIGKSNAVANALTRRAVADPSIHLTIFTALSLRLPRWRNDLERRFLQPFVKRVFGNYQELDYVRMLERNAIPANIIVKEFFLEPGAWLGSDHLQQHYVSSNYTHVARDLIQNGVNVIAQLVAPDPQGSSDVSLSSSPDLVMDLLPYIQELRSQGKPFAWVGQLHGELPFMSGDARVKRTEFDLIVDIANPSPLFGPPNMPIGTTDYAIALHVATLIKDGGTLQIGIGELGDAIAYALTLRHQKPLLFQEIIAKAGVNASSKQVVDHGGVGAFDKGLYGCTEMLVDGFIDLYRAGILKRKVYPHALLQRLLDAGKITTTVDESTLAALAEAGLKAITHDDFVRLQQAGVFRDEVGYIGNQLVDSNGTQYSSVIADASNRAELASVLAKQLRGGVLAHGGFFFGPNAFYAALRNLSDAEREQFAMMRISYINALYGDETLKAAQRPHARFVNTTMMVTGLGAAVSDGVDSGRVVSGVGGQYNFVAMAHALPDARSILCVRSTRTKQGKTSSNIVWNYGHTTIPRHLRDMVVTEYGLADLRGRTDCEVVDALVRVMDARFQDDLVTQAKQAGKLPNNYVVPDAARKNLPERIDSVLDQYRGRGLFDSFPFGSDFTAEERIIAKALKKLQADTATSFSRIKTVINAVLTSKPSATQWPLLERMQLSKPTSISERLQRRLVVHALRRSGVQ